MTGEDHLAGLRTEIINFHKFSKDGFVERRQSRINEALSWEKGPSVENPERHVVDELPDGREVYFLKPGKEVEDSNPNLNDMTPRVEGLYQDYRFDEIWSEIAGIGILDTEVLRHFLALVYRNAYLLDHEEVDGQGLRYRPNREIIESLNERVEDSIEGDILSLLHFLDVLGWNEDVKYHGGEKDYDLTSDFGVGRINTLLTCINIPYKFVQFINEVRENAETPEEIDLLSGLSSMQDLSTTGGTSKPTLIELEEWFSPILHNGEDEAVNQDLDKFL